MSTSETSTISLDKKISILAIIPQVRNEWAERFVSLWDMSIPLAVCVQLEWVSELSDKGVDEIERCFVSLCDLFGKTEAEMVEHIDNYSDTDE